MKTIRRAYRKFLLWTETRVVRCTMCAAKSGRQFPVHAERIARNHTHATGHVVAIERFGK